MIWGGFVVGYFGGGGDYPSFIVRLSFVIRSFIVRSGLEGVRGWLGGAWWEGGVRGYIGGWGGVGFNLLNYW